MEARNRNLKDWYGKIQRGEIKLPRFQRHEAWDQHRIASLMENIVHDLPLGITLTLEVGEKEQFDSRFLETTTPQENQRVLEHLLDGQQRLTALWRAFHNNYISETYFIYLKEFDKNVTDNDQTDLSVFYRTRYTNKNGDRYPLWCNDPSGCLKRGYIPTNLLKPEDIQNEIDEWLKQATNALKSDYGKEGLEAFYEFKKRVSDRIKDLRATVSNYNLPFLLLPAKTDKSVALDVFIKMNTNSKPLSQYDVIVAEVESVMGDSLHALQAGLDQKYPTVKRYGELSGLILTTSALLQGAMPNQRGAWDMDKKTMVEKWNVMASGLDRMAKFLNSEGIYDSQRLPTNAVLAVIAALYSVIPESGDKRGQDELLLKKYLWYAFFTDRYENSAATHAYSDFVGLSRIISGEKKKDGTLYVEREVPILGDHKFVDKDELMTAEWPKGGTIRGRAVLAVACRLGALDFSTGERIDATNISKRHYHHVYPDSLLREAEINSYLALNCALISDTTNMTIGRKDPLEYLKDRYAWTSEKIVEERLHSHLIPIPELANGGYEKLSEVEKKVKTEDDFDQFIRRRAEVILKAAALLAQGRQLSASQLFNDQQGNKDK